MGIGGTNLVLSEALRRLPLLVTVVALGVCATPEAHAGHEDLTGDPCEVQPVSRDSASAKGALPSPPPAAVAPDRPEPVIVWHCGTPGAPPPVPALRPQPLRIHGPRAPPHA